MPSRFTYEVAETMSGRFAVVRRLAGGDVAGYDVVMVDSDTQRHYRIYPPHMIVHAAAESRTYATRSEAEDARQLAEGGAA